MNITPEVAEATQEAIILSLQFITETVRLRGTIPSGELYALLMPTGMNLQTFENFEGIALRSGVISKSGNLLKWEGAK